MREKVFHVFGPRLHSRSLARTKNRDKLVHYFVVTFNETGRAFSQKNEELEMWEPLKGCVGAILTEDRQRM